MKGESLSGGVKVFRFNEMLCSTSLVTHLVKVAVR
jgi:hypothetical protein